MGRGGKLTQLNPSAVGKGLPSGEVLRQCVEVAANDSRHTRDGGALIGPTQKVVIVLGCVWEAARNAVNDDKLDIQRLHSHKALCDAAAGKKVVR